MKGKTLKKYVQERKKRDKTFAEGYDEGYEQFKIGVVLRQARETAGLTQEELAQRLKTKKTAISRIDNHAMQRISSSRPWRRWPMPLGKDWK